jgi:hypothetical protein
LRTKKTTIPAELVTISTTLRAFPLVPCTVCFGQRTIKLMPVCGSKMALCEHIRRGCHACKTHFNKYSWWARQNDSSRWFYFCNLPPFTIPDFMFMGPGAWETLSKPSGMWEILLEAQTTLEMGGAALRIWRRIKLVKAIVLTLVVSLIVGKPLNVLHYFILFNLWSERCRLHFDGLNIMSLTTLKQTSFLKVDMATWHSGRKHRLRRDACKQTWMETEIKFWWWSKGIFWHWLIPKINGPWTISWRKTLTSCSQIEV